MSVTAEPSSQEPSSAPDVGNAPVIAFVLFKYFPYGGLQRDFLRIATTVQARGLRVRVYTLAWRGPRQQGFDTRVLESTRWLNYRRYAQFVDWVREDLRRDPAQLVIGFNRLPGLDYYFAADPCFATRVRSRGPWYRWLPRTRWFLAAERAVFAADVASRILVLTPAQQTEITACYGTPARRFALLPPGIPPDRRANGDSTERRVRAREAWRLADDDRLVLLLGSGFRTKGLDRAIRALAALPSVLRNHTRLLAVGDDNPAPFLRLARRLGVADRVEVVAGRDDVPDLLQGADLLIHPARQELAGMVLLEAIVAGLPVLTTAVCGYAQHVLDARAGVVLPEPYRQERLNEALRAMSTSPGRGAWRTNGIAYGRSNDLYSLHDRAADLLLAQVTSSR